MQLAGRVRAAATAPAQRRDLRRLWLSGAHTKRIHKATPTSGGLMKFAKVTLQCLGCKAPLQGSATSLCQNCKGREVEHYYTRLQTVAECESIFNRLWTQCQRCQGDLHKDVLCASMLRVPSL